MGDMKRFGEEYRKSAREEVPPELCELCGEQLEIDPDNGEAHCPVCESVDQ